MNGLRSRELDFFFFKNTKYFNTHSHTRRREMVLKKLTVMYIQKGLTFGYTAFWIYTTCFKPL